MPSSAPGTRENPYRRGAPSPTAVDRHRGQVGTPRSTASVATQLPRDLRAATCRATEPLTPLRARASASRVLLLKQTAAESTFSPLLAVLHRSLLHAVNARYTFRKWLRRLERASGDREKLRHGLDVVGLTRRILRREETSLKGRRTIEGLIGRTGNFEKRTSVI